MPMKIAYLPKLLHAAAYDGHSPLPPSTFASFPFPSRLLACLHPPIAAMAALTLAAASCPSAPCLCLATSGTHKSSPRPATLLGANASLMNATSLRLQTALGSFKQSPQRRRWRCQAESVDTNETVAAGEQKVSEVKESLTEKQGPPVLTIIAGVFVAVAVIWALWSLVSAILGIFFH